MSSSNLFDSEQEPKSSNIVAKVVVLSILIVALAGGAFWYFKPEPPKYDKYSDDKLRDSIVLMLAQPRFSGDVFRQQVLGKAKMPWFSIPKKEFYFSLPEMNAQDFDGSISKFIVDKQKIENAAERDGRFYFPDVSLDKTPESSYFFKTTLENIKFDSKEELVFPFQRGSYNLSLREMIDLSNNSQVYGGMLRADSTFKKDGKTLVFANHGIMVAKPKEPSLFRFTSELLRDPNVNQNREAKIQTLLDFVTNEIEYDYSEALAAGETLKRPNETLMSRKSDCSNKTILMASMLEQIGEDYLMLYCPRHITVAVPQGNFPDENNLSFEWEGKKFMIAETTLPNFVIGKTKVQDAVKLNSVEYVQRPREKDIIFRVDTLRPLEFR
jgi:hypothetical protein